MGVLSPGVESQMNGRLKDATSSPPILFQVPSKAHAITALPELTLGESQKYRPSAKWPLAVGPNTSITS